jgi:flotillin
MTAFTDLLVPIVLGTAAVAFLVALSAAMKNWKRVPPEMAAVVYGRKFTVKDAETGQSRVRGFRIVKGGATFVVPVMEKISWLKLNVFQLDVNVERSYSKDGVPVNVEAKANVKIDGTDSALEIAAEQFGGMKEDETHDTIRETLQGHLRAIIGKLTPEEIYQDRAKFSQEVQEAAQPDLADMGFKIVTFPITDVRDTEGYLDSLGKRRVAEVKRDAEIGKAEAEREQMEQTSEAVRKGQEAKFINDQKIAEAERELSVRRAQLSAETDAAEATSKQAGPLAEAEKLQEVKQAQVAVEVAETDARIALQEKEQLRRQAELQASLITQANAEKQKKVIEAEADEDAAKREAEAITTIADAQKKRVVFEGEGQAAAKLAMKRADAEGRQAEMLAEAEGDKAQRLAVAAGEKARLLAEAEGEKARLLAEAEGKQKLAHALAQLDQTGKLLQVLEAVPSVAQAVGDAAAKALGEEGAAQIFAAAAKPLASVDEIRIIDFGGSNGANNPVSKIATLVPTTIAETIAKMDAAGLGAILQKIGLTSDLLEPLAAALKETEAEKPTTLDTPATT